jgi:hypothetical protein
MGTHRDAKVKITVDRILPVQVPNRPSDPFTTVLVMA